MQERPRNKIIATILISSKVVVGLSLAADPLRQLLTRADQFNDLTNQLIPNQKSKKKILTNSYLWSNLRLIRVHPEIQDSRLELSAFSPA